MTDYVYVDENDRQRAVERELFVRSLMELTKIDRAEAIARADRFEDPRFKETLTEVAAGLSPETVITNVEERDGGTVEVTVAAKATGIATGRMSIPKAQKAEAQALKYATDSMRASVARIEVAKVFKRRSLRTALHLLIDKGYYAPSIFWPALNPFRDDELKRQAAALAARGVT